MAGYTVSCYLHYLCKKTKAPMQYLLAGYFILYVSTASQPLGKREKLLDNFGQMRSTLPQLAGYKLWLPSASIALLLSLTFAQNTNPKHIFLCSGGSWFSSSPRIQTMHHRQPAVISSTLITAQPTMESRLTPKTIQS